MAIGDFQFCTITSGGWFCQIGWSGMVTGGTYYNGLNFPYQTTETGKIVFQVQSSGFDDNGNATIVPRTVYGTTQLYDPQQFPSGDNTSPTNSLISWKNVSSGVYLDVALSDFIYQKDQVTLNLSSSVYVSGAISSGVSNFTVNNQSQLQYPKAIADWSWPGYRLFTGTTFNLRAVAFGHFGQSGRPVRAVKFVCTDDINNTQSIYVNTPYVDSVEFTGDARPVVEYIATGFVTANFRQSGVLTGHFYAYPWIGDSNSVFTTSGSPPPPCPYVTYQTHVADKNNIYGCSVAVVNEQTGDNSVGQAVSINQFNAGVVVPAFKHMSSGLKACQLFNNTGYGRNDLGNSYIYMQSGKHQWMTGTVSLGNIPNVWVTITNYPTDPRSTVEFDRAGASTSSRSITNRVKIENVTLTGSVGPWDGSGSLWVHRCLHSGTSTSFFQNSTANDLAFHLTWSNYGPSSQGTKGFSTQRFYPMLVRGNVFDNCISQHYVLNMIGNKKSSTGDTHTVTMLTSTYSGPTTLPSGRPLILAFNSFKNITGQISILGMFNSDVSSTGFAIVQNEFEIVTAPNSSVMFNIASDASDIPCHGGIIANNVVLGQRSNCLYNDEKGVPYWKLNNHFYNNLFPDFNIKTNDFSSAAYGKVPERTGNWPAYFGVGFYGNVLQKISGVSTLGTIQFLPAFGGINGFLCTGGILTSNLTPTGWWTFVNDGSRKGGVFGFGNGNYHFQSGSPVLNITGLDYINYDLGGSGKAVNTEPPGPFAYYYASAPAGGGNIILSGIFNTSYPVNYNAFSMIPGILMTNGVIRRL